MTSRHIAIASRLATLALFGWVAATSVAVAQERGPTPSLDPATLADLRTVAAQNCWTLEQAISDDHATEVIGLIGAKVREEEPQHWVGAAVGPAPDAAPRLYLKGAASPFVRRLVATADIAIEVIDHQPYSRTDLEERAIRVNEALLDLGIDTASVAADVTGAGRIPVRVPDGSGTPSREVILAAIPADLRKDVDLRIGSAGVTAPPSPCPSLPVGVGVAPTEAWGPVAIADARPMDTVDAGIGPGRLAIGDACVVLTSDGGIETTLVFRDGQIVWIAAARAIRLHEPTGGLDLHDGDRLTLGGYDPWGDPTPGVGAPSWVVHPPSECPSALALVHSATVIEAAPTATPSTAIVLPSDPTDGGGTPIRFGSLVVAAVLFAIALASGRWSPSLGALALFLGILVLTDDQSDWVLPMSLVPMLAPAIAAGVLAIVQRRAGSRVALPVLVMLVVVGIGVILAATLSGSSLDRLWQVSRGASVLAVTSLVLEALLGLFVAVRRGWERREPAYLSILRSTAVGRRALRLTVEDERDRAAQTTHDMLLPQLSRLSAAGIAAAGTRAEIAAITERVRDTMVADQLLVLREGGLAAAIRDVVDRESRHGPSGSVEADVDGARPPWDVEVTALRIAQEAVRNVVLHASADSFVVRVLVRPRNVRLEIRDDGVGIEQQDMTGRAGHLGLIGMEARAREVAGRVGIERGEISGTVVRFRWPA